MKIAIQMRPFLRFDIDVGLQLKALDNDPRKRRKFLILHL